MVVNALSSIRRHRLASDMPSTKAIRRPTFVVALIELDLPVRLGLWHTFVKSNPPADIHIRSPSQAPKPVGKRHPLLGKKGECKCGIRGALGILMVSAESSRSLRRHPSGKDPPPLHGARLRRQRRRVASLDQAQTSIGKRVPHRCPHTVLKEGPAAILMAMPVSVSSLTARPLGSCNTAAYLQRNRMSSLVASNKSDYACR